MGGGGWGVRGRLSQVLRLSCCSKSHIYHTATSPRQEKSLTGRPGEGCVICSSGWMTLNTREWQVRRMKGDLVPGPCHFKCCPTFKGGARSSEGDKLPGKYLCAGSHIVGRATRRKNRKKRAKLSGNTGLKLLNTLAVVLLRLLPPRDRSFSPLWKI